MVPVARSVPSSVIFTVRDSLSHLQRRGGQLGDHSGCQIHTCGDDRGFHRVRAAVACIQ